MASKKPTYLVGCDMSLWQDDTRVTADYDFIIFKASEGASIGDPTFNSKLNRAKTVGVDLVGAYHYARTTNTPETDAENFLRRIQARPELGHNMILALDIEGEDLNKSGSIAWCRKWLDIVYNATGIKPVVYISASYTKYCADLFAGDYGLWVAHWGVKNPKVDAWTFWAFWQYEVRDNLDRDYFNGSKEQFLKYCKPTKK